MNNNNSNVAPPREVSIPLGVVLRRRPGATRWARWSWEAAAVLPGARSAEWQEMRRDGDVVEFHAATLDMTLHRTEVEGYKVSLAMRAPSVFVVLRDSDDTDRPLDVHAVTASAYEAQDYMDSGEELVEPVVMPESLAGFVKDFVDAHYEETPFYKRQRDKTRVDRTEDGIGDARIRQTADVYRTPPTQKPRRPQ